MTSTPRLILASRSPRRQELLREAGFDFRIEPADIDETDYPEWVAPQDVATFLAGAKAHAVAGRFPESVVLGADTVVISNGEILGKPVDGPDAARMIRLLSTTTHQVVTGVAVVVLSRMYTREARVVSEVRMRALSNLEIERYVAGGDWMGKAGGYGIQDADPFVERVSGCHTNIVGLPMPTVTQLLGEVGIFPSPAVEPSRSIQ